jgi:hypothetical protein
MEQASAMSTDQVLDRLADDASYFRPELFSVYGVDRGGRPFVGWGMQFGADEAVFYQPGAGTMHVSTSADQVLRTHQRTGQAQLLVLDD